ncbi:hypothetical protein BRARA_C03317 [Brassica rapa]|uniref:Exocyst complex component Sec8 n=1 Tax=Brassica campestris TaxID=3711 RepID=A0A398A869_BRACM|nr:hypothetical protein BRARA_C03317 [Brassica rapa]
MGIFNDLPVPSDKTYLREELARIDESWAVARFDSLPHVVHILTSKDREADIHVLREQSDVVEEVVDEVVHAYHGGFNKAIQNYSQILRLFRESTEKLGDLKHDLADAKKSLGTRNKQLHQLWYRSVTLRHIISVLDQIESISKVPSRIEKLIADKQFYAAIQVYLQSSLMLEREGLQTVGALQDVRSELSKLRGSLFFKILDDLHAHLYNRGEYSSVASSIYERDDEVPTTTAVAASRMSSQPLSRRTRTLKGDSQFGARGLTNGSHRSASIEEGSSFDGHDEEDSVEHDEASADSKLLSYHLPPWLSDSTPDEFIEAIRKSDDPLHVKYLQTLVECLCMLGKVAAAGAIICQKLRPTIHEIIISKIKAHMETRNLSKSGSNQGDRTGAVGLHIIKGQSEAYRLSKDKPQNGMPNSGSHLAMSPVSPLMAPGGKAQAAAKDLLDSILDTINFVKDHLLPTMFVDYRKGVQQAISSAAAFRPRAHSSTYTPTVEKGRPILQGLLAIDLLAKEVLGWAQAMPKFATDLVKYVQTFLERTFERCRTSYMEAVLEKLSYRLIGRHDIERLMRLDAASACLPSSLGHSVSHSEAVGSGVELNDLFLSLPSIKQDNLIRDDNKLILLASLSDSLEYVADSIERLGQAVPRAASQDSNSRNQATSPRNLASFADEYRKLATDCLKVLRVEMQLETVFHLQEMTNREYLEDEDAEEPDDFVISLTSQITRRDEGMAPFISGEKRNYIFGGICGTAASASIKALADMRSINLFGVQQICRNTIALEQAMAAIPYIDGESVQQTLDRVRTYFELLNMPFEALLAFIAEHDQMFTPTEYSNLLKVNVPGRDTPPDAQHRLSEILSH